MKNALFAFVLIAALGIAAPSWADLDQHCLSLCKSSGRLATQCLTQCTYDVNAQSPPSATGQAGNEVKPVTPPAGTPSHNVFNAPAPSEELILPPKHTSSAPQPSIDYHCAAQCMKSGGQYKLCNDSCTRVECAAGSPQCKDLRGFVPNSVMTMTGSTAPAPIPSSVPSSNYTH
jgi:hypothetical protein